MSFTDDFLKELEKKKKKIDNSIVVSPYASKAGKENDKAKQNARSSTGDSFTDEFLNELGSLAKKNGTTYEISTYDEDDDIGPTFDYDEGRSGGGGRGGKFGDPSKMSEKEKRINDLKIEIREIEDLLGYNDSFGERLLNFGGEDGWLTQLIQGIATGQNTDQQLKDLLKEYKAELASLENPEEAQDEKKDKWYEGWLKGGAFSDGYQVGDLAGTAIATVGDTALGVAQGFGNMYEGITDFILQGGSEAADWVGLDSVSDYLEKGANKQTINTLVNSIKGDYIRDNTIWGEKGQSIPQGVGNILGMIYGGKALSGAGLGTKGVSIGTSVGMGASSAGSGISDAKSEGIATHEYATQMVQELDIAFEDGRLTKEEYDAAIAELDEQLNGRLDEALDGSTVTDIEAWSYGTAKGTIDALTELMFGGLGKGVEAVGISRGIGGFDDIFAKKASEKLTKHITNKYAKRIVVNGTEYVIKASGEGLEEVIATYGDAFAKKLTYMSDEELSELINHEEALEAFISSFVASGITQGGDLVSSVKGDTDFVTGYTDNEQAVIDKEIEKRITEQEKDGKKLTNNEKKKITEAVKEDLDKGYISIDTIEKVLGGDSYKSYRETVESEDALKSEFEELEKVKTNDATLGQSSRYNELKNKLAELETTSQRSILERKYKDDAYEVAKGSRLESSYFERARGGEAFTADLSKYDEKQRATIQSAIDAGFLNNRGRTHDFVNLIAKIAADKGVTFDFLNNEKLKTSGFAVGGAIVNGYYDKKSGTVGINLNSDKALNTVVGHEITHVLEGTEIYNELQTALINYAKAKGDYQGRVDALSKLYDAKDIDSELTADLVGDYLFTDADFVNRLSTEHRNVFQKVFDEIKYLYKTATAGSKEARELEKVKRVFEEAYRTNVKGQTKAQGQQGGTQYMLSKDINGDVFVDVTEDIFDANNGESVARTIQRVISERFNNLIDVNGQKIQINKTTNDEFRRSESVHHLTSSNPQVYDDKLKTIANADEILLAAKNWIGEEIKHIRKDDIVEFARGNVMYRVGGNGYVADVIVGTRKNGAAVLYDLVNIYDKKITEAPVTMASNDNSQRRQDASAEPIVSQKGKNVNTQFSVSTDSDGNTLSDGQKEFFKDSKVVDRDGNLLKVYHTTNSDFTVFDDSKKGSATEAYNSYLGHFFTNDPEYMSEFPEFEGGKTEAYYLNMKNPIDMNNISRGAFLDIVEVTGGDVTEAAEIYDSEYEAEVERAKLRNGTPALDLSRLLEELTGEFYDDAEFHNVLRPNYDKLIAKGYDGVINNMDGAGWANEYVVLNSNQAKLVTNTNPTNDPDTRYSLSSIANTFFGDENMSANEFMRMDYRETQGYKDYVDQCLNNFRQTRTNYNENKARGEIEDSIAGIVRVAVAAKQAGYDIYDDATKRDVRDSKNRLLFSSLEPNSDYFTSNDISTECDKRKNFAEIYDAIVKKEEAMGVPRGERFFDNVDNYFYIHKVLADKGLTQPCRECYVESMRKNLAPMANAFIKLVGETDVNNTANEQLYNISGKDKGKLKANNAETREKVREILDSYGETADFLTVEMLTTDKGLAELKITKPEIYEAFNSFYGQSKPKLPRAATPFRFGELTALLTDNNGKIKQSLVNKINSTGGFRLQSYSDFQVENYTDTLQVLFEAGTLGLRGHAYTKVPAFLDATEGTNLKRNISIFMYKDGNEWKLDRNDSFPYTLEEIYDIVNADEQGNTGIIAVSQNDDMSAWIMANDNVGYGIPFHKSGLKMDTVRSTDVKTEDGRIVKGYSGTKDHTKQQTEVWAKASADHKALTKVKKGISIYELNEWGARSWDFNNKSNLPKNKLIEKNVKAYIDACEKAGYLPKFRDYVRNNGKVLNDVLKYSKELGYVSQDATIEDISFKYKGYTIPYGYYKFLGDFGMFKPDGTVSPHEVLSLKNYDFDKAVAFFEDTERLHRNEILQQFANGVEREKYRNSNLTAGELRDIVKQRRGEIADGIVSGEIGPTKRSLSAEGEPSREYGSYNVYGRDMTLGEDIAPIQEDVAPVGPAQAAPETVGSRAEILPDDYAPMSEDEAAIVENEALSSLTDEDAPPVVDMPYYEQRDTAITGYMNDSRLEAATEASHIPLDDDLAPVPEEDALLGQERSMLLEDYESKKADIQKLIDDKNGFISKRANELYWELSGLKKGVRASRELGYLLDQGYSWGELKTALVNTKLHPDSRVREDSAIESIVREALNEEYENLAYEIDEIDSEYNEKVQKLEADAKAENKVLSVREVYEQKLANHRNSLAALEAGKEKSLANFNEAIGKKLNEYNSLKNKNTKRANTLLQQMENLRLRRDNVQADYANRIAKQQARLEAFESKSYEEFEQKELAIRRRDNHKRIVDGIKARFTEQGYDLDEVFDKAKNLSTFATVDNTPQRVMEKSLGYKEGQILSDLTVDQVARNESEGIKWLNSVTNKKDGLLAQLVKKYGIKPGSKASAAAQMYAEGFFVDTNGDVIKYGDAELAKDFPNEQVRQNIIGLARDQRVRQFYDETLDKINESRVRNAYPEIQKLDNYFLHFRAMEDTFSRLGLPFNPNDIKAKDLPTDLNGVTADLKPGQPYFASARHREGIRTSHDLLGGLERYASSAKNQIYHIDDIQTLRAIRNYIADGYGQAKGLESLDSLSEEEAQEKIKQVYGSHLSTFAKFLNEEANVIAGKTALIDRGLEGIIGRRGITLIDTINKQVGANMVGFNVSSSLTNFIPVAQTFAKSNKFDFTKAFAQTASNKINSIFGRSDEFIDNNPTVLRRRGADRFYQTPYQKVGDIGYTLMGVVDDISTELIVRTKYNEYIRKGMSEQDAVNAADKWTSRLMADRSLGQMPQIYNSRMLGLFTKFQLEVRNQLDAQFYDTIQEKKVSNEDIENGLLRNAKTAAQVTSTFAQLAIAQHLYGMAFEAIAGYNPAFDIVSVLATALGFDDDEDDEDTVLDNLGQGFLELLEDLPYTSALTGGGRIPISSALPVEDVLTAISGQDANGNEISRKDAWKTVGEAAPYYFMPGGYGQLKKTIKGMEMFDEDLPIAGSYTDSGKLRYPVDDTVKNRLQAAIFGQYANENAGKYFDGGHKALDEKQIQEFIDVDIPIEDYWDYREGLYALNKKSETGTASLAEKIDYIMSLDLPIEKKNLLANNLTERKEPIDLTGYEEYGNYKDFDFATKYPEKYAFLQDHNISVSEYEKFDEDTKEAYTWASKNPAKYKVSKAISDDLMTYRSYTDALYDIKADKDEDGKSISGSRKEKVINYINNLDADYGQKIILFKSEYPSDDTYNYEIIDYLNGRDDISYSDMVTILTELGFKVDGDNVYWD